MPDIAQGKARVHPRYQNGGSGFRVVGSGGYVELEVTTNFSFLRGASHPEEYIQRAAQLGYGSVAITDRHSFAGIVRAHTAAKQYGVRLVVGCRVSLSDGGCELLLYPTNRASYGRLTQLLTTGKLKSTKGNCTLTTAEVLESAKDLLAIVVVRDSPLEELTAQLTILREAFTPSTLSLGISRFLEFSDRDNTKKALMLQKQFSLPLVALNDVHYHIKTRRKLQDVLTSIRLNSSIAQIPLELFPNSERFLKSPEEMKQLFADFPEALLRSVELAEQTAGFSLDELRYEYPNEICPGNKMPQEYLTELAWRGAKHRYPGGVPQPVRNQIEHELALIKDLDYAKYFLTVYDIVSFARARGILCQGRGAAANSAVCFCLEITSVDPDRINILFERFISKERNEPPDIDIDFEHERREEVIQYIYEKYGRQRAALVAEVITYRRRSAVRDVGKALGLSLDCVEAISRALRALPTNGVTPQHLRHVGLDPEDLTTQLCIELSNTIIGFPRHLSQHVGGFVITESPLSEFVPIENAAMPGRTVIEWDKDDIEVMGMLKIDVLALGMLTCIRKAFSLLEEHQLTQLDNEVLTLHAIPAEDSSVYDMICRADTMGVFQIESRAQMSMLPRLRPRCFYDLVIEVAIVRPGPIQGKMVHPYLRRRSGSERAIYPDKRIEAVLSRTLGVPLFQEQAMQLAVVGAGFSPGEADALRRAMAGWKRKEALIESFRKRIIEGMVRSGYTEHFAMSCFEQLKGFGEYGFPESHAASFALLVYISAWLKKHFPAVFAAGLLNSQPMGFYQPAQLIQDAERHGVKVLPIDVNFSQWDCILEHGSLRLGMRLIKGLSSAQVLLVTETIRQKGHYSSIISLWRESGVRVSTLRILARANAFQSMRLSRQQALWAIRKLKDAPLPLFDSATSNEPLVRLPRIGILANVLEDYERVGFSFIAHPISLLRPQLRSLGVATATEIGDKKSTPSGLIVSVCGLVLVRQRPGTASGVVFLTIEDETGIVNLIARPHIFRRYQFILGTSAIIFVSGRVERDGEVVHILVDRAQEVQLTEGEFTPISRDFH